MLNILQSTRVTSCHTQQNTRFGGQAEQAEYYRWLSQFPDKSKDHLATIKRNEKNEGPKHIALAVGFGVIDQHIRQLNQLIRGLIRDRNRGRRTSDTAQEAEAKEKLYDLREAIAQICTEHAESNGKR